MANITEREQAVINAIALSDFGSKLRSEVWTSSVAGQHGAPDGLAFAGVVSSLVKKGLVWVRDYEGRGRAADQTIRLTEEGAAAVTVEHGKSNEPIDCCGC